MAKRYFTTGEAAEICGVSRSTIARRFDLGELTGEKNAVTAERKISRESLVAFMERAGIPVTRLLAREQAVLLASASSSDREAFRAALESAPRQAEVVDDWLALADALSHRTPSLLILDADFPGIALPEALVSIRARESLRDVRIVILTEAGAQPLFTDQVRFRGVETLVRPGTPQGLQPAFQALFQPQAPGAFRDERRRTPRAVVDEEVEVAVVVAGGRCHAEGRARLANVSEDGAWLSHLQLEGQTLPAGPFFLRINKFKGDRLPRLRADLQPARFSFVDGLNVGGPFTSLSDEDRQRIRRLFPV